MSRAGSSYDAELTLLRAAIQEMPLPPSDAGPLAFKPSTEYDQEAGTRHEAWLAALPNTLTLPDWVYQGDIDKAPAPLGPPDGLDAKVEEFYRALESSQNQSDIPAKLREAFESHVNYIGVVLPNDLGRVARAIHAARAIDECRAGSEEIQIWEGLRDAARGITAYTYGEKYGSARALEIADRRLRGLVLPDPMPQYLMGGRRRGPKAMSDQDWLLETGRILAGSCQLRGIRSPFALDGETTAELAGYSPRNKGASLRRTLFERGGIRMSELHAAAWQSLGSPALRK